MERADSSEINCAGLHMDGLVIGEQKGLTLKMNKTLYALCTHAVNLMDGWHPIPARFIAEYTNVSLSTARRRLRELKEAGLAKTFCEAPDSDCEFALPYWGWGITDKARETEEYKKAYSEELEARKEIWPDINWEDL